MSIAIMRHGRLVWSEGLGYADVEHRTPVTPLTRFPIASLSKSLTVAGAALLGQEGRLDWDAAVQRYVPSFPVKRWAVTPRHLAGSVSGIRHYADDGEAYPTSRFSNLTDALRIFQDDSLLFEPGTKVGYSSHAYVLLGAIIEGASGQGYTDFMRENVFEPLGMLSTGPAYSDSIIPYRSQSYSEGDQGERIHAPFIELSGRWPSGGLLSTAEDLARFGTALLGGTLLTPATVEMLWSAVRLRDGTLTNQALGWELGADGAGRRIVHFDGNLPGARALIAIHPDEELVVVLLANTGKGIFLNKEELFELLDLFVSQAPAPPSTVPDLTGTYEYEMFFDGEQVKGTVQLYRQAGEYRGLITVPHSFFGQRPFPAPIVIVGGEEVRLIGVLGTWIRLRLALREGALGDGTWSFGDWHGEVTGVGRLDGAAGR